MSDQGRTTTPKVSAARDLSSELGWRTRDRIVAYGHDLPGELLGNVNLGAMGFLGLTGRLPAPAEDPVFTRCWWHSSSTARRRAPSRRG